MNELVVRMDSDWLAARLTSRKIYPPKLATDGEIKLYTGRWHPGMIDIPGPEGFEVSVSRYKGKRCLLVSIACKNPFVQGVLRFARKQLAEWDDAFNVWKIPVLSQVKTAALAEAWEVVESAFFEIPWQHEILEMHWRYALSEQNFEVLQNRIQILNCFWESGEISFDEPEPCLVFPGISRVDLEQKAIDSFHQLYPDAKWEPESEQALLSLCVNYLRHKESAYHILLKSEQAYGKTFRQINLAIATAYPWLEAVAKRQISTKEGSNVG